MFKMKNTNKIKRMGFNWFLLPIEKLQSLPKNKKYKLLDVGAQAHIIKNYLPSNIIYDTLDYSNEYGKKNTFIHNLDNFPIPIKDNSYDIIQCSETLEHTMYPHKVMKELIRIAKPDALFLISLPNDYNIVMRIYYLLGIKKTPPFRIIEEHQHIHTLRKKDTLGFYNKYLNIEKIKYTFCFKNYVLFKKRGLGILNFIFNFLSPIIPSLFARIVGVVGTIKEIEK